MTQLVDWDLAISTARLLSKVGPTTSEKVASAAVTDLRQRATDAIDQVSEFTGLAGPIDPPVLVVDRTGWCRANVMGLRQLLDPLSMKISSSPSWLARNVGSRMTGAQAGTILGYLSGRVLGQFEVFGDHYGRLLLVAPNIIEAERQLRMRPEDFRTWVCLHEATHAVQFGGVPWLRQYFLDEINDFAGTADTSMSVSETVGNVVEQTRRAAGLLVDSVRDEDGSSVLDLVTSPQQRTIVDRLTALMSLLEGHADYVMDRVGETAIGDVAAVRRRFDRRRHSGGPLNRIAKRLLGMDAKLAQYERGAGFVDAVIDEAGKETFDRVWERPENLPTIGEIAEPSSWVARIQA